MILYSKLTYKFNDTHSPLHSPAVKCCSYHNILPRKTIYLLVIFFLSIKKSWSPQKLYGVHGDSMRCDKFGDENMRRSYEFYYVYIIEHMNRNSSNTTRMLFKYCHCRKMKDIFSTFYSTPVRKWQYQSLHNKKNVFIAI